MCVVLDSTASTSIMDLSMWTVEQVAIRCGTIMESDGKKRFLEICVYRETDALSSGSFIIMGY